METVISEDQAIIELEAIQEIFDVVYDDGDKEKILPAIMAGRFMTDEANETIVYSLFKPVKQKDGNNREDITFHAPTVSDMEYINKDFTIKTNVEGETVIDIGKMQVRTSRAIIKLSKWPLGLVDRISRKDMRVFSGLFNFFD